MNFASDGPITDWSHYMTAAILVLMRLSALVTVAPLFSSPAIAPRIKAAFVFAMALLLTPAIASVPGTRAVLDARALLGELSVGLVFGLSLMMLNEALSFAGTLLGFQFSFSLVNLLDPNSSIETPVLGQMLSWLGILAIIGSGLDRSLLLALFRSFAAVPLGQAALQAKTGIALATMASGIFLAGLQLAAPVMAAALVVEVTIALVGRLAPQLPAMIISIPLKTLVSYVVLAASLALWPHWIEQRFTALLDSAGKLMVQR
jgi:flagellar biosynthetic protein FliR